MRFRASEVPVPRVDPGLAGVAGLLQTSFVIPAISYATSGDLQIAYQVVGDGPVDVMLAFDWAGNIELMWENPQTERFLRRFASYGRLIFFDMRGIGLSDPVEDLPPLEEWMDDVRAVMDAVGSDRAALVGHGHAGQLCMLVAAAHPDRVQALVTVNSFARLARAPGYRAGMPEGAQQAWIDAIPATGERPTRCICGCWPPTWHSTSSRGRGGRGSNVPPAARDVRSASSSSPSSWTSARCWRRSPFRPWWSSRQAAGS
jgi:pimeloyl-ACP methyl ester carboxylesterase